MARPKSDKARLKIVTMRLLPAELVAFKRAADTSGLPLTTWIRQTLRRAVGLPTA